MEKKKEQQTPTIESLIEERDKYKDLYLRALADYQNLQRRSLEEKGDIAKQASNDMLLKILHLYKASKEGLKYNERGAHLLHKAFVKFLTDNHIGIIDTEFFVKNTDNKFNEDWAIAISVKRPDEDCLFPEMRNEDLDNKIYSVIEDGFYDLVTKKVISFAKVIVYKVD